MHDIVKAVIDAGRYELVDMLQKIDTLWLQGSLTDDEREGLVGEAREKADPTASWAPLQAQIDALAEKIAALTSRVEALDAGGSAEPEPSDEWPEYVQPTGAHDAYHKGDKITYNGKRYTCTAPDGVAVVWDPATYPAYWEEIT